jgi:hypothetical protein
MLKGIIVLAVLVAAFWLCRKGLSNLGLG